MTGSLDAALAELVAVSRRAGIAASVVEAVDVQRAALAVGLLDREDLKAALRSVLVKRWEDLDTFDRTFDAFFAADPPELGASALTFGGSPPSEEERRRLEDAIRAARIAMGTGAGGSGGGDAAETLSALVRGRDAVDQMLRAAASRANVARMRSSMQIGFFTRRTLAELSIDRARELVEELRAQIGEASADALSAALDQLWPAARQVVSSELARRNASDRQVLSRRRLQETSFVRLDPKELERVTAEVRRLGERLRGRILVRRKRQRRGSLDVRGTLRRSLSTGGVPFAPVYRRKKPQRPKLVLLCDVSDSVRYAARFFLMLVYSIHDVLAKTRSFAFVADTGEATDLFEALPAEEAIARVHGGDAVRVAAGSDYGAALASFVTAHADAIDPRTTLVILGDGRANYQPPRPELLARLSRRAARVLWLNPESRSAWGFGDSAMEAYLPHVDEAWEVSDLASLRRAVDRLVSIVGR